MKCYALLKSAFRSMSVNRQLSTGEMGRMMFMASKNDAQSEFPINEIACAKHNRFADMQWSFREVFGNEQGDEMLFRCKLNHLISSVN